MTEILTSASQFLHPYLYKIAMAITAALLVLFGDHINGFIRDMVKDYNFFVRLTVFLLVVAFGYGALTLLLTHLLSKLLAEIPNLYLFPSLLLTFVIIGLIAEEKKHI
ncbi:MAG: DUF3392 family protein [Kiritimatiellae bacterium]|nr:DUF3392 family protein [Kiritimatiellia bacterium]MDD5521412.1 DUF3392 family protein [Kiritimatiellia bacterium]